MNHSLNACEGDEEVGLPQLAHNGHTVLVQLLQVARAAGEARAQDDSPPEQSLTSKSVKNTVVWQKPFCYSNLLRTKYRC